MKAYFILAIILFLINTIYSQESWSKITGQAPGIELDIFGQATFSLDTLFLDDDAVYRSNYISNPKSVDHAVTHYGLHISRYPSTYIHSDSSFSVIEGFINSFVAELLESSHFEYINSALEFQNGYPGKSFKFKEINSNKLHEYEVYLIQNYLIELTTHSASTNWFSKSKSRFYDSFNTLDVASNKVNYGIPIIESDSYSIHFPSKPEINNLFIDSNYGIVNTKMKILDLSDASTVLVFMSGESKYNEKFVMDSTVLTDFYIQSMNGSIKAMNAEHISHHEFKYNQQLRGIEFNASLQDGKITSKNRILYNEGRLYTLGVLTNLEGHLSSQAFIDSFSLKE